MITEEDLVVNDCNYGSIFEELPEPDIQEPEVSTFYECFNDDVEGNIHKSGSAAEVSDEEFGEFVMNKLREIEDEEQRRTIKREIVKMF